MYQILDQNILTGTIPSEFGEFQSLKELWMCKYKHIKFTADDAVNLRLYFITILAFLTKHLDGNKLVGTIPTELAEIQSLEILHLGKMPLFLFQFRFDFWSYLTRMIALSLFEKDFNDLNGAIPTEFGDFASLQGLYLSK